MQNYARPTADLIPIGIGTYTVPEAARLLRMPAITIRRWLGGYSFRQRGKTQRVPPLWTPQLPAHDGHIELGFRDLIELRFVQQFTKAGVGLKAIRASLNLARQLVNDARPFSTRQFRTDGRTIFLETIHSGADPDLLDLKRSQFVIAKIIERCFKDLDIGDDAVSRWRPFHGKASIVIDPARAFGQPITAEAGIPTVTLADAVKAEGSLKRVAYLYGLPEPIVRDADTFERSLIAA